MHSFRMSERRKVTLLQILADPKNRQVSSKFFKFSFLLIFIPIGFMLLSIKTRFLSVEIAAIVAVIMVNVIMGYYALGAYREELDEFKDSQAPNKKND
jgi:hypothetical protein